MSKLALIDLEWLDKEIISCNKDLKEYDEEDDESGYFNIRYYLKALESIKKQLQSPVEEISTAYQAGFNEAYYSMLHPDKFPKRNIEMATKDYLKSKGYK